MTPDIVYSIISYQVVPEHGHCWDLFGQAAYKIYHAEQKYCALIGKNEHAIEEEQGMVQEERRDSRSWVKKRVM